MNMRAWLQERRRRRDMATWLAEAEANGKVLIAVPSAMAAEVRQAVWRHNVETAAEKWATRTAEVPLAEWQANVTEHGRKYRGHHRD